MQIQCCTTYTTSLNAYCNILLSRLVILVHILELYAHQTMGKRIGKHMGYTRYEKRKGFFFQNIENNQFAE